MPVYQVDIEKIMTLSIGLSYFWTNVYHVNAADQAAATASAQSIVTAEKSIHATNQAFTKMRVRQVQPTLQEGAITTLSGNGGRSVGTDLLPAYCVARVDFSKAIGRPCRKYLRINISEIEQTNGILQSAVLTSIANNYIAPIVALGVVCDDSGDLITGGGAFSPVQMRQLRRGSKRRVGPVI